MLDEFDRWLEAPKESEPKVSETKETEPKFDKVVSIKVTKGGEVFYNKQPVSVDELGDELNKLDNSTTAVCYYREAGTRSRTRSTRRSSGRSPMPVWPSS